jgi:hypothetical protein
VLVTGILGSVLLPLISILLIVTVIGAPIGVGLLFLVLPAIAFLAWIVAAVWIGDWFVERMRGSREPERPVLAAVLGVVILAVAGILPFVGAIATLFGFGALLLDAWRMLRGTPRRWAPAPQPAPWPADRRAASRRHASSEGGPGHHGRACHLATESHSAAAVVDIRPAAAEVGP